MIRLSLLSLMLFAILPPSNLPAADVVGRPNIVLIFSDDLGWADLSCYGNSIHETPNLDQLAEEGLRYTRAYASAPICSASRASLLTGKTTARLGFEFVVKGDNGQQEIPGTPLQSPPFTVDLPLTETTLAEVLGGSGYETAFFGKWHLNKHYKGYLGWSPTHGPGKQGFQFAEEDFGSHPYSYWKTKAKRSFDPAVKQGEFPDDSMVDRANAFLNQPHEKPFFLMVSQFFVHDPNHTRLKWLYDKYRSEFEADDPRRDEKAHYAAMVTTLDHLIGRVLKSIDEAGLRDTTLVLFTSDNGGHPNYAGNAPLRGSKWNLYEGGVRVPMIARWPGKTKPASVCEEPVIGYDLLPTFADVAGVDELPVDIDGQSFAQSFSEPTAKGTDRPLLWHFPYYHPERGFSEAPETIGVDDGLTSKTRPHAAIRSGNYKLIHFFESEESELYDLSVDPYETKDMAGANPEKALELERLLQKHLKEKKARLPVRKAATPFQEKPDRL